jgi:hypothetical protein
MLRGRSCSDALQKSLYTQYSRRDIKKMVVDADALAHIPIWEL